jgi:hypothetical protein
MARPAAKVAKPNMYFEFASDVAELCNREGHAYTQQERATCEAHERLAGTKCGIDAVTQEEIPEGRVLRMYSINPTDNGSKRLLRCFDALSLKQHVAVSDKRDAGGKQIVLDPTTNIPFSDAQIQRIKAFVLPGESQREFEEFLHEHHVANVGRAHAFDQENERFARGLMPNQQEARGLAPMQQAARVLSPEQQAERRSWDDYEARLVEASRRGGARDFPRKSCARWISSQRCACWTRSGFGNGIGSCRN